MGTGEPRDCLMVLAAIGFPPVAIAIHLNKCGKEMCLSFLMSLIPFVGGLCAIFYAIKIVTSPRPQIGFATMEEGDGMGAGAAAGAAGAVGVAGGVAGGMIAGAPEITTTPPDEADDIKQQDLFNDAEEPPPWEVPPAEAPALDEKPAIVEDVVEDVPKIPDEPPPLPQPEPPVAPIIPVPDNLPDPTADEDEGSSEESGSEEEDDDDEGVVPNAPWDGEFYGSPRGDADLPPPVA